MSLLDDTFPQHVVLWRRYGMLCTALGQFDESFRYGQLSLDLLKKFRTKEYLPRVFAAVYGGCYRLVPLGFYRLLFCALIPHLSLCRYFS